MNLSIRFHQVTQSNKIFDLVDHEARKIESYYPDIISCTVVIDKPHNRHRKSNPIRAQLTFSFPGGQLVFSKSVDNRDELDSALAALSHAFEAAEYTINGHTHKQQELNRQNGKPQLEAVLVPAN
jgi:ribosome-associated translation inhibitor RaiA